MVEIEDPRQRTVAAIFDRYTRGADERRGHLGASIIGRPCSRSLWYAFRWALREEFDGRILRLFERGKREEVWLLDELRAIGCEVLAEDPSTGEQWRVSFHGGHFGGSADGVVLGLVEAPKTWHLFEAKTANDKSWTDIARKGVKVAKPEHFLQMQVYLKGLGLTRALYLCVNKNDDRIYQERVEFDRDAADAAIAKAGMIVGAKTPPTRISEDPTWYECKWCSQRDHCHLQRYAKIERNCRTCASSTPMPDGTWLCEHYGKTLSLEEQVAGCEGHVLNPGMLDGWKAEDASDTERWVRYRTPAGEVVHDRGGKLEGAGGDHQ